MKSRREFVKTALASTATACLGTFATSRHAIAPPTADSRIDILLDEPQGTILPDVYGHFTEHLGGVMYDGLWVGPKSKVPNIDGLRRDVVEHMRTIKAPVVRYPGGCFADSYDWRDGVGPADKRPRRTNFWNGAEGEKSPANHKFESKQLLLTVGNPHVSEPREAEIVVRGGAIISGSVRSLTNSDIHARNTFEHRDAVMPSSNPLKMGAQLVYTFPPASASALTVQVR